MKKGGNMKVSVSVLKEYDNLEVAIDKVNKSSANYLHIDVMDGIFVNNSKFPLDICEKAIKLSNKETDVHLMVNDVETIKEYANLKPNRLTFHVEVIKNNEIIKYVKSLGIKVGLAINPETNINELMPYVNDIDLVLFMSVNPGLGGQKFINSVTDKIKLFKKLSPKELDISIDGGVNNETINSCREAGCNIVVAGSYVTNMDNYDDAIVNLT